MKLLFGLILRAVLMLAGLVFVGSLLLAGSLVLLLWLVRALWAKLTGRPVNAWTFQINRQAVMDRFYRAPGQGGASHPDDSDVIDAEVKEVKDVIEVNKMIEVKEIKSPER